MNHKRFMRYLLLANLFVTSIAGASVSSLNLTPYGGVDLGIQNIKFQSGYGDNLFKSTLPKGNFYLGLKFNECFGVEAGYESTLEKKKNVTIAENDLYLGTDIMSQYLLNSAQTVNRIKLSGWHLGITGEYKFYLYNSKLPLSILGYIGIKNTKINLKSNINNFDPPVPPPMPTL
ncbi:MAG: outer membrane beta-barrel protein, partial [Gammaproteobacteria bacterium]